MMYHPCPLYKIVGDEECVDEMAAKVPEFCISRDRTVDQKHHPQLSQYQQVPTSASRFAIAIVW